MSSLFFLKNYIIYCFLISFYFIFQFGKLRIKINKTMLTSCFPDTYKSWNMLLYLSCRNTCFGLYCFFIITYNIKALTFVRAFSLSISQTKLFLFHHSDSFVATKRIPIINSCDPPA